MADPRSAGVRTATGLSRIGPAPYVPNVVGGNTGLIQGNVSIDVQVSVRWTRRAGWRGATMKRITSDQVGKCGELFVQYHLLKEGIDSPPMTTDPGIDLVTFSAGKVATIQVKTSTHRSDSTNSWVEWAVPNTCPASHVAIVDLEADAGWILPTAEFHKRGTRAGANRRLLWSTDSRWQSPLAESNFHQYKIGPGVASLLP